MTKHLIYIDTTRAILITLVVLGHVLNYANPQYNVIPYTLTQEFMSAFHMPAFFLLSGLLTDGEKWRSRPIDAYFVHKARTLLIPYLFFECLALLYKHFVLHSVSFTEGLRLMLTIHCNVDADRKSIGFCRRCFWRVRCIICTSAPRAGSCGAWVVRLFCWGFGS